MRLTKLKLMNFRNYDVLDFKPGNGINVILGENAQGKTNVLEALFMCAFGRSHRTPKDNELVKWDKDQAYIGLDMVNYSGSHTIEFKFNQGESKKTFIDGAQASRSGELLGILNVVMFAPENLKLVKDSPLERRRFIDMEISQLKPAYFYRLQQYNLALKQRNALLKESMNALKPGRLAMWDEQLANLGEQIMLSRGEFIEELAGIAKNLHSSISGGKEALKISYQPNIKQASDIRGEILEKLALSVQDDIRRGYTSVGPHRDDLFISINGNDARLYGSQGQQRTAALALKLSELTLIKNLKNEYPVLLLDDVLSELDETRQRLLFENVDGCQCILTCTSLAGIEELWLDIDVFECALSRLTKC